MTNEMPVPTHSTNQADPLAERWRAAYDRAANAQKRSEGAREEWIDATLELGEVVLQARRQYPDNNAFGGWLVRNGLRILSANEVMALMGFARDPEAGRKLLQASRGWAWRTVWENKQTRERRPLTETGKRPPAPHSRRSGSARAKRAQRIPDVMQDQPPRPQPAAVRIKGLTREEVDPDFKGNAIEFSAKYGPVNIHTKDELERSKRQDALQKWLGAATSLGALARPDPATLAEWAAKPGRAARVSDLQAALRQAADLLETVCPKPREQIAPVEICSPPNVQSVIPPCPS